MRSFCFTVISCFAASILVACAQGPSYKGTFINPPMEVPAIVGTDLKTQPFDSDLLDQQIKVVFFGYTFCPDICPGIMNVIAEAYNELPRFQDQIEVIFVTVDPIRDTPTRLEAYLSNFHEDFQGVRTETAAGLDALNSGFGIFVESHRDSEEDSSYLVDHTTRTYVLDREGHMALTYGGDMKATDLAHDLRTLLRN